MEEIIKRLKEKSSFRYPFTRRKVDMFWIEMAIEETKKQEKEKFLKLNERTYNFLIAGEYTPEELLLFTLFRKELKKELSKSDSYKRAKKALSRLRSRN